MKYSVMVREVWVQSYEVEAESAEEAIDKVDKMEDYNIKAIEDSFEIDYVMGTDTWNVFESKD